MQENHIQTTFSDGCDPSTERGVTFFVVNGAEVQVKKIRPYRFTTGEVLDGYKDTTH